MDSCKWKITYNNPTHCSMMELAHTPTRPPWRPAASSITANLDLDVPPPQWSSRKSPKSTELTIPPQYMNASDLIAAMPKRHRMPKPQALSNALAMEPRSSYPRPKTPWAPSELEAADFDKQTRRSSEHTPKSVLDQAAKCLASDTTRSRSNTGRHGSQLASPPSGARSLLSSAAQSERGSERSFPIASPRLNKSQHRSPGFPISQPPSPPRNNGSSNDRASPASPASAARSPERSPGHSPPYSGSAQLTRNRTTGTNTGLVSASDIPSSQSTNPRSSRFLTRGSSSRMNTTDTHNYNLPSRGTTGGSVRSNMSSASSTVSHRSTMEGSPASGRCSPPRRPAPRHRPTLHTKPSPSPDLDNILRQIDL